MDTPGAAIKKAIDQKLADVKDLLEESFSYGQFADAGAARFKEQEDMWQYLVDHAGNLSFDFEGQQVYIHASDAGKSKEDRAKSKGVRKLVRTVIEANGGNGAKMKAEGSLYANYRQGCVLWCGERLGTWNADDETMNFTETGEKYAETWRKLMAL
eukprot:7158762-Karenia_brevis.AAC.1